MVACPTSELLYLSEYLLTLPKVHSTLLYPIWERAVPSREAPELKAKENTEALHIRMSHTYLAHSRKLETLVEYGIRTVLLPLS